MRLSRQKMLSLLMAPFLPTPILYAKPSRSERSRILNPDDYAHWIASFNQTDHESPATYIPNADAYKWMSANVPLFECPDPDIEETYYFRWWTYRKHIRHTEHGFVVDEFLPEVPWAGRYNTISCAAGHHFYEGRWLADPQYLNDYALFWFRGGGDPRRYSFWAADAIYARSLVTGDPALPRELRHDLEANYAGWNDRRDPNGLYWQIDDRDGMEVSIGGSGYRATINSYQFGDCRALAQIAALDGDAVAAQHYQAEADRLKALVEERLWDSEAQFFKVLPRGDNPKLADVRELHGYTPWYFGLPGDAYAVAWKQLMDPQGFYAPFGPTSAERRHPRFNFKNDHECLWNGPSWPFATSITLTALANLLNGPPQTAITATDYLALLRIYAKSQRLKRDDGTVVPWIDEDLDGDTGVWLARTILASRGTHDRGKDYNHSTFCDLVISGLVGLRSRADDTVEVNPLVPPGAWDYFCLDRVRYHGHDLTIFYDRTGHRYNRGAGLHVLADGQTIASAPDLRRVTGQLPSGTLTPPETLEGWTKYAGNPVLGGDYGTCFDIAVMHEDGKYRMWFSWRPKASVALVESVDCIHWSEPKIVLSPNKATGWEDDINRPVVVKRADGYHMCYTGQSGGRSAIGYATSPDGITWTRASDKPVLTAAQPWEKGAVMCPHVLWDETTHQYRMWYSGGDQYEPNAIGYATSPDGLIWTRLGDHPVFAPDPASPWEADRVTACQVTPFEGWYYMFYIGFRDVDHAQIGIARSRDGITAWQRHPANPIIRPGLGKWDHDACYKPYALFDGHQWLLWYNGRHGGKEQIGLATHAGRDLGF